MPITDIKRVFISHSHHDRHMATELQKTLADAEAETYLDQDTIQAGDNLPERIREGIKWCNTFLLIWSRNAVSSAWVEREWNSAYELKRRIIPYILDKSPLPPGLDNLVFVEVSDRNLADSNLLRAVFGQDFAPDPTTLFPGHWRATRDVKGQLNGNYELELRPNGQVIGEYSIAQGGEAMELARISTEQLGLGNLWNIHVPIQGWWSYDKGAQLLTMELTANTFGPITDTVKIYATGHEKQAIMGTDFLGCTWKLWRDE